MNLIDSWLGVLGLDLGTPGYSPALTHSTLFPSNERRPRPPRKPMTTKQTYTDIAKGVVRQSDWITGCELSCFGASFNHLLNRINLRVSAQFDYVASTVDKPEYGAESVCSSAVHRSILRKYQNRPPHGGALTLSPSRVRFTRRCGGKLWTCYSEVHRFTDTLYNTVTTASANLPGLWIMFLRDCKLA